MEETANATNEEKDAKKAAFQVAQLASRSEASRSASWAVATATVTRFHAASATRTCGNCSIGWTPTTVRPPPLEYVWPRGEGRGSTVDSVVGAGGTLDKADLPKILYGMEGMANALKSSFNLMPKSPEFENKKPNDFKGFQDENS